MYICLYIQQDFHEFIQNKHVQWGIIAIQFVLIIAIILIRMYAHNRKIKRIWEQYERGEYAKIVLPATKLKKGYALFPSKANDLMNNQLSLILASSALRLGNDELFRAHIKDVSNPKLKDIAIVWWTIFHLNSNNMPAAEESYRQLLTTEESARKKLYQTFLDAMFAYRKGDCDSAQSMIASVRDQVENPVMKDFVEDIVSEKNHSI